MKIRMAIRSILWLVLILSYFQFSEGSLCNSNNVNASYFSYDVLPGSGWDNLKNEIKGRIILLNFTSCQVSEDGKYLVPDGVYLNPLKSSYVEIYSDIIKNWQNFTSDVAATINAEGSVSVDDIAINGKFSFEYESVKKAQVEDDAATLKVRARYVQYMAKMQPDPVLDPKFKERIINIAHHLQFDRKHSVRYESQLLVRDFGTHIITGVDAGAAIVKIDHVKRDLFDSASDVKNKIALLAQSEIFGINGNVTIDPETLTAYHTSKTRSSITTHGGQKFRPVNFNINDWVDGIDDNLVTLDRSGDPIYYLLTPKMFPELPLSIISKTSKTIAAAIRSYYKHNTYPGCTDRDSPNFSFNANVEDGSCRMNVSGTTFGGLFQNCTSSGPNFDICDSLQNKNPLTGEFSCPEGFEIVPLFSGHYSKTLTQKECSKFMIFWEHCKNDPVVERASYQSYWCAAIGQFENPTGFVFGGVYTDALQNLVTQQKSCPPFFHTINIAEDIKVCVSDDYEEAAKYAVPFRGFYSCQYGNGMYKDMGTTTTTPKACPAGFSQHLAAEVAECDINYCMSYKSVVARNMRPIRMPPFFNKPLERNDSYEFFVANDAQSWTRIYAVNDTFHGFNGTIGDLILDSGDNLDIRKLLNSRQNSLGISSEQNSNPRENNKQPLKRNKESERLKGKPNQNDKPKFERKSRLPHGEIAAVAGLSAAATLILVLFIVTLVISSKRMKTGDANYKKMSQA